MQFQNINNRMYPTYQPKPMQSFEDQPRMMMGGHQFQSHVSDNKSFTPHYPLNMASYFGEAAASQMSRQPITQVYYTQPLNPGQNQPMNMYGTHNPNSFQTMQRPAPQPFMPQNPMNFATATQSFPKSPYPMQPQYASYIPSDKKIQQPSYNFKKGYEIFQTQQGRKNEGLPVHLYGSIKPQEPQSQYSYTPKLMNYPQEHSYETMNGGASFLPAHFVKPQPSYFQSLASYVPPTTNSWGNSYMPLPPQSMMSYTPDAQMGYLPKSPNVFASYVPNPSTNLNSNNNNNSYMPTSTFPELKGNKPVVVSKEVSDSLPTFGPVKSQGIKKPIGSTFQKKPEHPMLMPSPSSQGIESTKALTGSAHIPMQTQYMNQSPHNPYSQQYDENSYEYDGSSDPGDSEVSDISETSENSEDVDNEDSNDEDEPEAPAHNSKLPNQGGPNGHIPPSETRNLQPENFLRITDPTTNQMRAAPLTVLHKDPQITFCKDLLTPKECQFIIETYKNKMQSMSSDDDQGKNTSGSHSAVIQPSDTPIIKTIEKRVAALVDMPIENMEPMVIVNYGKDQYFNRKHDGNMRQISVLLHLNTIPPNEGGETLFSFMGIKIKSVMGSAVFWKNRLPNGEPDYRVLHEPIPLTKGSKWIINCYFNEEVMRTKN